MFDQVAKSKKICVKKLSKSCSFCFNNFVAVLLRNSSSSTAEGMVDGKMSTASSQVALLSADSFYESIKMIR